MGVLEEIQKNRLAEQAKAIRKQYEGAYFQGYPIDWGNLDQITVAMNYWMISAKNESERSIERMKEFQYLASSGR